MLGSSNRGLLAQDTMPEVLLAWRRSLPGGSPPSAGGRQQRGTSALAGRAPLDRTPMLTAPLKPAFFAECVILACVEEFAAGLASAGRSPHFVQHISNVAIDYQNGIFSGTNNIIFSGTKGSLYLR